MRARALALTALTMEKRFLRDLPPDLLLELDMVVPF